MFYKSCFSILYKLTISVKHRKERWQNFHVKASHVFFVFVFFKNFVCRTRAKIINTENVSVIEIINTGASGIIELLWSMAIGVGVSNPPEGLKML